MAEWYFLQDHHQHTFKPLILLTSRRHRKTLKILKPAIEISMFPPFFSLREKIIKEIYLVKSPPLNTQSKLNAH